MKHPLRGASIFLTCIALAGCAGAMSQREAQGYASTSLRRYCADNGSCSTYRVTQAQRLGAGWMVDFESASTKYGVMVRRNGTTQVTAWKKDAPSLR